nr:hypothetical protein [Lachnospiraceae bacterium]
MIKFYEDSPHKNDLADCLIRTVWTFCAFMFLYWAAYNMASTVLTAYSASGLNRVASAAVFLIAAFIYETILPFSAEIDFEKAKNKSYRAIIKRKHIGMFVIILIITAALSFLNYKKLYGGIAKVTEVFFSVFGRIYGVDIRLYDGKAAYAGFAMTFIFTALTLVFFAIAKIVGKKLITAIPGILLIAVPMIDGRTPEWFALSCLVIGCIIIINEADAKERFFETFLRVGLIALAFLVSGVIFSGRAEDFLEKAEDAKRFQSTLEEKLKIALGQNGYSTMFIDNTDLKYSGSVQMTVEIETDTIPSSSLYYKNFTGQDYTLGAWNRAGADFDETFEDKYYDDMNLKEARRTLAQNIYDYVNIDDTFAAVCNVKTVYKTDVSTSIPYYSHINNDYLDLLEGDVNPTIETSYDTIELPLVIA